MIHHRGHRGTQRVLLLLRFFLLSFPTPPLLRKGFGGQKKPCGETPLNKQGSWSVMKDHSSAGCRWDTGMSDILLSAGFLLPFSIPPLLDPSIPWLPHKLPCTPPIPRTRVASSGRKNLAVRHRITSKAQDQRLRASHLRDAGETPNWPFGQVSLIFVE